MPRCPQAAEQRVPGSRDVKVALRVVETAQERPDRGATAPAAPLKGA